MTDFPQYPIHFLYYDDGYYWYGSHCCDYADPHTGFIVSLSPLRHLGCQAGPVKEQQAIDPGDDPFNGFAASKDAGNHEPVTNDDVPFRMNPDGTVAVTVLSGYQTVTFSLSALANANSQSRFNRIKQKYYSLKMVNASYAMGICNCSETGVNKMAKIQIHLAALTADRCRILGSSDANIAVKEILSLSQDQNIFILTLENNIEGLDCIRILAKNEP